jgi:hypothetical protein
VRRVNYFIFHGLYARFRPSPGQKINFACCAQTTEYVFRPAKCAAVIVGAGAQRHNAHSFPDSGSGSE